MSDKLYIGGVRQKGRIVTEKQANAHTSYAKYITYYEGVYIEQVVKPSMESQYPYYCPCGCYGNVLNCVYADKGFRDWVVKQPDYQAATHNAGIADKLYREFQKVSYESMPNQA